MNSYFQSMTRNWFSIDARFIQLNYTSPPQWLWSQIDVTFGLIQYFILELYLDLILKFTRQPKMNS